MKPVHFDQANTIIGENQDEYDNLPAHINQDGVVATVWEFTPEELQDMLHNGRKFMIYVYTFNQPFQPILPITFGENSRLIMESQENG